MITSHDVYDIANLLSSYVRKERDSSVNAYSESAYRSAISRYYYSAFIELRSILLHLMSVDDVSKIKHAAMPDKLKKLIRLANKNRTNVSPHEHWSAMNSLKELATIIERSRELRENCDYDIGKPLFATYAEAKANLKVAKNWYKAVASHRRIVESVMPRLI